jgi:hypothetical protein
VTLPSAVNIERLPGEWLDKLKKIDERPFLTLKRCGVCGQLWQLDLIDKLQTNLAIKFDNGCDWHEFDDTPFRIPYLIDSRGGVGDRTCIVQDCRNLALQRLAYCPGHAYDYVGLRE